MILLDTHIWVWWTQDDARLSPRHRQLLASNEAGRLGVSVISCWEIAKPVELGRLALPLSIDQWLYSALGYPGVTLVDLTPAIAVESTRPPAPFHRDPADQMIVATARLLGLQLMSVDSRIVGYPHVKTI